MRTDDAIAAAVADPAFAARFWSKVDKHGDCWLWLGPKDRDGYGKYTRGRALAHRIAWTLERGPIPAGLRVLHACDVPACCNIEHLRLGTQGDNMRDMASKGRNRGGHRQRLTEAAISEARQLRYNGATLDAIAARLGCTRVCVAAHV